MNMTEKTPTSNLLLTTKDMTLIGLMTAVLCCLGPISIPIPVSPVPLSLTNLVVLLTVFVLGMKHGFISYLIYFLLGIVGLPIFSGFSGGLGKAVGPTGGYLIGFFFMALIAGFFIDKWHGKKFMSIVGMVLGVAICNIFGTIWLSRQLNISFIAGLSAGVIPYLPGDIAKIILAAIIGPILRKSIKNL